MAEKRDKYEVVDFTNSIGGWFVHGGNPDALVGPSHDALLAANPLPVRARPEEVYID